MPETYEPEVIGKDEIIPGKRVKCENWNEVGVYHGVCEAPDDDDDICKSCKYFGTEEERKEAGDWVLQYCEENAPAMTGEL